MAGGLPAETLTDVQRAARFYYLQHQGFSGKVQGQIWGTDTHAPPVNLRRIEEQHSVAHLRLAGTYVERLDWRECIKRYDQPHTCFYLDPPYWQTEGYGVPLPFSEYLAMSEAMRNVNGKALLSINDHPDIRSCFSGMHLEVVEIGYQVGGGTPAARKELVMWSWDQGMEPAGLS